MLSAIVLIVVMLNVVGPQKVPQKFCKIVIFTGISNWQIANDPKIKMFKYRKVEEL